MPKCPSCEKVTNRRDRNAITFVKCPHSKDKFWKVYWCSKCGTNFYGCKKCGEQIMWGSLHRED